MRKLFLIVILLSFAIIAQSRPADEKVPFTNANDVATILLNSITGSGTTNQLAYFTGTRTIASLSTVTYPNLTEFSYLKGVTSSIQAQLNGKQPLLISGSTIKTVNGQSLLGSGNIVITTTADTTGLYAKIVSIIQSLSATSIVRVSELDSMVRDYRANNFLRLNK